MVGYYHPFLKNSFNDWGTMIWTSIDGIYLDDCWILNISDNFQQYPVRAALFLRYPTMILASDLPQTFRNSYFARAIKYSTGLGGYDGLILGNLAMLHNFSVQIINATSYGSLKNDTFSGEI